MKELFRKAIALVRLHRRAYLVLNVCYYATVGIAMLAVTSYPEVQQMLTESVLEAFSQGTMADVAAAYAGGNVVQAMVLTFLVNF